MFWIYLFYIAASELLILTTNVLAGVVAYTLLVIALTIHATLLANAERRLLARGLLLLPLARLLSLSIPFGIVPVPVWSIGIVLPLLIAVSVIARQARLNRARLGVHTDGLWLQVMLACGGFGIAVIEYAMFAPTIPIPPSSIAAVIMLLSLLVFAGLTEELLFRGLLQRLAIPALGRAALIYVSLLAAALCIGYRSPGRVAFAFGVALCFAVVARWSKSIVAVALAHGLSNVTLYLLMPFSMANPSSIAARMLPWVSGIGTTVAVLAFSFLLFRRVRNGIPSDEASPVAALGNSVSGTSPSIAMYNRMSSAGRKVRSKRLRRPLKKVVRNVSQRSLS